MANKQIRISITSALNAAGIEATKQQVDAMGKSLEKSMQSAAGANRRHWADIKAAWDMGCTALRKAWQAVTAGLRSAFKFETQTAQFKTLVGNIDEARRHMQDLKELGDTPPFGIDQFAEASRALMRMTDGVLGYKKSLELIGDAAAATGYSMTELGQAVGRMYAFIRDGQPLSRAVMQLRNMGIITPEVAQKLQDLQDAGKSNGEIWEEVERQLLRYKGAMAETEKTGDGLMGAIQSRWDNIVRAFGKSLSEDSKDGLTAVHDAMKELEEDGSVEVWANRVREAFETVKTAASAVGNALSWVWKNSGMSDIWATGKGLIQSTGAAVTRAAAGIANGEGVWDALVAANYERGSVFAKNVAEGHWLGKAAEKGWLGSNMKWAADDNKADAEQKAKEEERIRERARKEREVKEREKAQREAEEEQRIKENLAAAQKAQEEEAAKKAAEAAAEEERKARVKAAEKAAKEQERLDREAAARRERERQREVAAAIAAHQKILDAERQAEADSRAAVSAAESKLQQAWGWYRDKESMAAQIAEEKANAAAIKQYEKDFEKLKSRRRDWRDAENLSVDDEAVRRVALAREEKRAAERHLAEIERNTADLAAKLDDLLTMKGGE